MQSTTAFAIFTALPTAFFGWLLWSAYLKASKLRRQLNEVESSFRQSIDHDRDTLARAKRLCGLCEAGEPDSIPDAIERLYLAYQHNKPILEGYKQDFHRVQSQLEVLASERDILHRHWEGATKESAALREELERTLKQLERMHVDLTETTRQVVHFESNERDLSALLPEPSGAEIVSLVERVRLLISERDSLRTSFDSVMRQRDSLLRDVRDLRADLDSTAAELRTRTTERDAFQRANTDLRSVFDTIVASLRLPPAQQSADGIKNALGGLCIARDHLDSVGKLLTEADYHLELTTFGKVERLLAEYKETTHRLAVVTSARDGQHKVLLELERMFSEAKFHPELTFVGRLKRLLAERRELQPKASLFVQIALTIGADRPDPEFVLARAQSLQSRLDEYAKQVEDLQTRLSEANREAMVGQNLSDRLVALRNVLRKGLVNRSRATKPRQFPVVLVRKNYGLSWVDSERVCGFLNLEPRKLL